MTQIKIGDRVICETGVTGIVVGFYMPTSCEEQTKVLTDDGRLYHAPTRMWTKYKDGFNAGETESGKRRVIVVNTTYGIDKSIRDIISEAVVQQINKDIEKRILGR